VYWFRLVRGPGGVDWVPYKADGDSGIGRQLVVHDINGDGLPDIAAGGMKGASVLLHRKEAVTEEGWRRVQPPVQFATVKPYVANIPRPAAPALTVPGAIEGEKLPVAKVTAGRTRAQNMVAFTTGKWSGGEQLFWSGAKAGDRLDLEIEVNAAGTFDIAAALTKARDYAIVQVLLDDEPLGGPIDLFSPREVTTTGEISFGRRSLTAGKHQLAIVINGANSDAVKSYMVGLDYFRLSPSAAGR
jgi:hypothetical protein